MIREQIKKDLKEAVEKSGVLGGDFLDNIEWLLKNVNKDNFENFPDPLPVGRLSSEVQKAIGAGDNLVYLKPRIYAKIRGWWRAFGGHSEINPAYFLFLPLFTKFPEKVLADKKYEDRFLLVCFLEHTTALVVEIAAERNEIVTFFWMRKDQPREHKLLWESSGKEKRTPDGRTCIPSVLAPRHITECGGVAGSRFPSLRQKVRDYINTIEERCQVDILGYSKTAVADEIHLEHPANPKYGDYSSNIALTLKSQISNLPAGKAGLKSQIHNSNVKTLTPEDLAGLIVDHFPETDYLEKIEIAGAGFINFFLKKEWLQSQVGRILGERGDYGINKQLKIVNCKLKIQLEFISANPTGPLHVGNARGGFCGDVLANILSKIGYQVQREYYINDKGGQVDKLARSVRAYYDAIVKSEALDNIDIPGGGYPGEYVKEIAQMMLEEKGPDQKSLESFKSFAISEILKNIKRTIVRMGVEFDNFFSEQSLYDTSQVKRTLKLLEDRGLTYKGEGAVWFRSSQFGDDKDRVLIKSDGEMTYLVSDLAYHLDKFEKRKFDKVVLFWGADHHGYIPRFLAMIEAVGHKGKAQIELIQLLKLARGGKTVRMSKRAGEYVTVDDVLDEIGLDAARFHFLAVPLSTPMTLDLAKAAEQSEKNPVYYVQYACARMHGILAKSQIPNSKSQINLKFQISNFKTKEELALIRKLIQFPEVVVDVSENHEVHRLPQYSIEVADAFHKFYENCRVLSADPELTAARLGLVRATKIILGEALSLMGIKAPERM